jgi:hypothetical protein
MINKGDNKRPAGYSQEKQDSYLLTQANIRRQNSLNFEKYLTCASNKINARAKLVVSTILNTKPDFHISTSEIISSQFNSQQLARIAINTLVEYGILIKVSHGLYCLKYPGVFTPLQEREKQESLTIAQEAIISEQPFSNAQKPSNTDTHDSIGQKLSDTHESVINDVIEKQESLRLKNKKQESLLLEDISTDQKQESLRLEKQESLLLGKSSKPNAKKHASYSLYSTKVKDNNINNTNVVSSTVSEELIFQPGQEKASLENFEDALSNFMKKATATYDEKLQFKFESVMYCYMRSRDLSSQSVSEMFDKNTVKGSANRKLLQEKVEKFVDNFDLEYAIFGITGSQWHTDTMQIALKNVLDADKFPGYVTKGKTHPNLPDYLKLKAASHRSFGDIDFELRDAWSLLKNIKKLSPEKHIYISELQEKYDTLKAEYDNHPDKPEEPVKTIQRRSDRPRGPINQGSQAFRDMLAKATKSIASRELSSPVMRH